jgi:hypothetical protein
VVASALVGVATGFAVPAFERVTVNIVFDHVTAHMPIALLAFAPGVGLAIRRCGCTDRIKA